MELAGGNAINLTRLSDGKFRMQNIPADNAVSIARASKSMLTTARSMI